eukprot:m.146232 g.146232  ORF g.146232 m.146232 type:complete len:743 (-) comp16804_c0_seq1:1791-4019(-)
MDCYEEDDDDGGEPFSDVYDAHIELEDYVDDDEVGLGQHAPGRSEDVEGEASTAAPATAATSEAAAGGASQVIQRLSLNPFKAGMEGVDQAKVNAIIYEASKGSKFFLAAQERAEETTRKIAAMREKAAHLKEKGLKEARRIVDQKTARLEGIRDLSRVLVHIDMDSFYAAVEIRDNPSYAGKPIGIGGMSMLSTCSYEARKYGVRSAMPGFVAKRLCPDLILVPHRFEAYREASNRVREIIARFDPNYRSMGLDEAYVDLTDYLKSVPSQCPHQMQPPGDDNNGDNEFRCCFPEPEVKERAKFGFNAANVAAMQPQTHDDESGELGAAAADNPPQHTPPLPFTLAERVVFAIRAEIFEKTKLTASAGIAANSTLAKICTDWNKPNGQYYLPPVRADILAFLHPLPCRKIPFIGKVTEQVLGGLGVNNCKELFEQRYLIHQLFSEISSNFFLRAALGIQSEEREDQPRKSMSTERTFYGISDPAKLRAKCSELCQHLAEDLASEDLEGKCITIKLKTTAFKVLSRAESLPTYISSAAELELHALQLFERELQVHKTLELRLFGVRMSSLRHRSAKNKSADGDAHVSSEASTVDIAKYFKRQEGNRAKTATPPPIQSATSPRNDSAGEADVVEVVDVDSDRGAAPSSASASKAENSDQMCPICGARCGPDLREVNEHIDLCLTRAALREEMSASPNAAGSSAPSSTNHQRQQPQIRGGSSTKKAAASAAKRPRQGVLDHWMAS